MVSLVLWNCEHRANERIRGELFFQLLITLRRISLNIKIIHSKKNVLINNDNNINDNVDDDN